MNIQLQAQKRDVFGKKVKHLRKEGLIPCQIYGKGVDPISVQVPVRALRKALREAGNTNLIYLAVENQMAVATLAKDVQYTPLRGDVLHVDFHAVDLNQTVTVSVPVHLIGTSELTKQGGVLMQGLNSLDIETKPQNLPESIEVDISIITDFNTAISVADLDLPEDWIIHSNEDSMLATIQPPREEEEEEVSDIESLLPEPEVLTAVREADDDSDDA
jgi:large subunit ribosomal protein L25